jgi:uncharacterized protein (DUF2141 family)
MTLSKRHGRPVPDMCVHLLIVAAFCTVAGGAPKSPCVNEPGYRISGVLTGFVATESVYIALYSSKDEFAKARPCQRLRFLSDALRPDSIHYVFAGRVPAGDYMIAGFQDMDCDSSMATGMFGIPKEPFRIHRPNYGVFGPSFGQCKFRVDRDYDTANLDFHKGRK